MIEKSLARKKSLFFLFSFFFVCGFFFEIRRGQRIRRIARASVISSSICTHIRSQHVCICLKDIWENVKLAQHFLPSLRRGHGKPSQEQLRYHMQWIIAWCAQMYFMVYSFEIQNYSLAASSPQTTSDHLMWCKHVTASLRACLFAFQGHLICSFLAFNVIQCNVCNLLYHYILQDNRT